MLLAQILFISFMATVAVSLSGSGIPVYFEMHKYSLSPSSTCYDGSRATFYHRNCTANGDRKPFDPTDFCAGEQTWVIDFLGGPTLNASADAKSGAFCFDSASCAARAARDLSLVSSTGLKPTLFAQGVTLPFPEVNPNLYKQHSVIVPYCTGDLWAGRGALIADDVILALGAAHLIGDTGLRDADRVILVGPAGIMARLDELAEALRAAKRAASGNASAILAVLGVCDGCLLPIVTPPPVAHPSSALVAPECTTDADCPPARALPLLAEFFNISVAPSGCHPSSGRPVWECFTAEAVVESLGAARTPALLLAQQYDARVAASYGEESHGAWAANHLAPALRALVAATPQTVFGIAPACGAPAQLSPSAALFDTKVAHTNAYNVTINATVISGFTTFIEAAAESGGGKTDFGSWIDTCTGFDCMRLCP
jgi:hypothetical protein